MTRTELKAIYNNVIEKYTRFARIYTVQEYI